MNFQNEMHISKLGNLLWNTFCRGWINNMYNYTYRILLEYCMENNCSLKWYSSKHWVLSLYLLLIFVFLFVKI